jgi:CDP-paratose 2-epimerase
MSVALVTGSGGLVGSALVTDLVEAGWEVAGVDNDMRGSFFGEHASTAPTTRSLIDAHSGFRALDLDIRDEGAIDAVFAEYGTAFELVVHAAAQPSHDWAAREPRTDFTVNANGTLNLLESSRRHAPEATFVHISTNKVYGDLPNSLPLVEFDTRLDLPEDHRWFDGIDTTMSIDRSTHSLFGVSKTAADLLAQEYGRYFGMPTASLRCGCLTGPAHAGTRLHGFLSYLMKCVITGTPYTIFGYGGKQVRDNLHGSDLSRACLAIHANPRPASVYNMGGGRGASCSVLEAIEASQRIAGRELDWELSDEARVGDHRWWISDLAGFQADYPDWAPVYDVEAILSEIHEANADRWLAVEA